MAAAMRSELEASTGSAGACASGAPPSSAAAAAASAGGRGSAAVGASGPGRGRSRSRSRGAAGAATSASQNGAAEAAAHSFPRRVFLMRHGLKEENVPGKDNLGLSLTAVGKQALRQLAIFCEAWNVRFGRVLCSPYIRCRETAAELKHLSATGSVELEPGLCEVLSNRTGLRNAQGLLGEEALQRLRPRLEEIMSGTPPARRRGPPLLRIEELEHDQDPELCVQVVRRGLKVVRRLSPEHFAEGPLLLVTHGGPCKTLLSGFLDGKEVPYDTHKLPEMGSMTLLEQRGPEEPWRVIGNVLPEQRPDGAWTVRWRAGHSSDTGDVAKL